MTNEVAIRVLTTPRFKHVLKKLRKKYAHVIDDLKPLLAVLAEGQTPGDQIPDVGYNVYKTRLPNRDAQRGKSGGYRLIYYLKTRERIILIDIYSKTEQVNISADEIHRH
ncbi:MAG: type II toxin-antitoxin system RelE/ParE family toxin [Chloroflexi bacterium]|nr:type II toxin-antitoxin system RelE/ParE family toxin [Chloroflexota bacterium]MCC6896623.1 type II toxin-antitoxin system RelE/ParE family toxin [Anaerolineae bacterium]